MFQQHRITVVIPAQNEEKSIGLVIEALPKDIVDEVIVVDNGSADKTAEVARRSGARVVEEKTRGYGAACLRGISHIKETSILVILDADYSDYPEQITRLLEPIVRGEADFVLGSRMLGECETGALTPQQYWGNKLATFLIRCFFGFRFTDMGPFRAIRFESLKTLGLRDRNFGWNAEMQIKAIRKGLRIREVPVDYRNRIGHSKISGTISGTLCAGFKNIFTIFKYALS